MVDKIFIIMPAYNAGKTIERVFARIPAPVKKRVRRYVVVNDGCSDDTDAALDRLVKRYTDLVVLKHEKNLGYGAAERLSLIML